MSKEEPASCEKPGLDLDTLLVHEIGQFGRYQWRLLATAFVVAAINTLSNAEYIFTTARINTRCLVPECEVAGGTEFSPPWLVHAVPSSGGALDGCQRYAPSAYNVTDDVTGDVCPASLFDPTVTVPCEQYVFENTHTIVYDLELACDEWRRSLVGSVRTLGSLFALPVTGFVSDRWGRRTALVLTAINTACLGTVRYWANSYTSFVIGQFMEAALGSGTFPCTYILLLEVVGPKYRVRAGATAITGLTLGYIVTPLVAWLVPYWRHLTLALFLPQFLGIFYFWIFPESIRWYQSKGKFDKAEKAIKKVARVNGKNVSEKTLLELKKSVEAQKNKSEEKKEDEPWLIVQVFQHKPILIRCLISSVWWITAMLVYYGLSINSINMVGNRYLNFALVSAVEIPGVWLSVLLMDRVGRRPVLAAGFWVCALCQLGYIFTPQDMITVSLLIYLVGKSSSAMVMTILYVYAAELYPTKQRHRLFAFSVATGNIGSLVAPLTPALGAMVFDSLPFVLFGGMAVLAGLLVPLAPETRGAPLPDTMQQAARLGREPRTEDHSRTAEHQ